MNHINKLSFSPRDWLTTLSLTVVAGLLYSSWPLGYWLNPTANRGLASNLEAAHQPYGWLFAALDIVSGILVCIASYWLLRLMKQTRVPLLKYAVIGFAMFGLLTAIDALLPLDCVNVTDRCGPILTDPTFVIHGIISIGSIMGLTISIMSLWWLFLRGGRAARNLRWLLHGTMLVWFGFGMVTAVLIGLARQSSLSQHLFITVCSAWTALLPYLAVRASELVDQSADIAPPKAPVTDAQQNQRGGQ
jgi:hypothetical protein